MKDPQNLTKLTPSTQRNEYPDGFNSLEASSNPTKDHILSILKADWQIIYQRDPAARNWLEVLFCYPGLQALWFHRVNHWLYEIGIPFVPRFLSQVSRLLTGIEIHPGAQIGKGVFIDHGMGVVIGETTVVGDYTLIYQGATLGGTGKEKGKRHPTLGQNVMVGAGAKVLGNIQIGDYVRIGAGSVVLRDVPSHSTVVGVPGRIARNSQMTEELFLSHKFPDQEAEVIRSLFERLKTVEQEVVDLRTQLSLFKDQGIQEPTPEQTADTNQMIEEFLSGAGI
jgi:serine O-acetyltransferase